MPEIDRSRQGMKRRIAELNSKHCKDAADLQKTLNELVSLEVKDLRQSVVAAVIECMNRYAVAGTPVDTGRARAGWHLTGEASDIEFKPAEKLSSSEYQRMIMRNIGPLNLNEWEVLYVVNNVEYILALNAGWSKRQAGGFIDRFMQELGARLNEMAARA